MGVMKGYIEKERPLLLLRIDFILFMSLEEFADQEFDAGDVPSHLEDRAVLLCVCKIKRIHRAGTHVLLPNDA